MALAVFRYEHKNRAVNDYDSGFACDDWYCSRSSGKVRSQGLEAEVSGKVATGLELAAGYTYNTTRYLSDPDYQGQIFNTWTPRHMLRLWGSYRLPGELEQVQRRRRREHAKPHAGLRPLVRRGRLLAVERAPGLASHAAAVVYRATSKIRTAQ
ncbi:MAG: TonB-dependent receptor [Ruthenibacterium sp.]